MNLPIASLNSDELTLVSWDTSSFLVVVVAALGYLFLQSGIIHSRSRAFLGLILIGIAGGIAAYRVGAHPEQLLFLGFTALATAGSIVFLVFRQPVHCALGFAVTVLATCGLFFLQSAPFLAAAMMIVYAGATIIIFLFVLMFAHRSTLANYDIRLSSPVTSAAVAAVLLTILVYAIRQPDVLPSPRPSEMRPFSNETHRLEPSSTATLGRSLFSDYLWSVELAGTLLLVAVIGAIAVAQRSPEGDA